MFYSKRCTLAFAARIADGAEGIAFKRDGLRSAEGLHGGNLMAKLLQRGDCVGAYLGLNRQLIGHPLVMEARGGHGFLERHAEIKRVQNHEQSLTDDRRS